MRMWMVDPKLMCRAHLLGEHNEHHKHLHNWKKQHRIDGRISGNAIEPLSYKDRHDKLAMEMERRGYNHKSPIDQPDFSYLTLDFLNFKVDVNKSFEELQRRCENCRKRSNLTE